MIFAAPSLDQRECEVIASIESLRERLARRLRDPRRWSGSLRRVQLARGVQASNSIEGYQTSLDDTLALGAGQEPSGASPETRRAVVGYQTAMTYVLQLAHDPQARIDAQLLKSLHFMMTGHDLSVRPGLWRAGPIYVRNEQTGATVYEGSPVDQVDDLVSLLTGDLSAPDMPTVVSAAMAHLNLVMIHPFRDGNGRMARCLQTLVLARDGVISPVFSSIEEYLGRNTRAYYDILASVGGGSWQPVRDARPWIRFVLTAHLRQASTVLQRAQDTENLYGEFDTLVATSSLPERVVDALYHAAIGLRVRNGDYRALVERNGDPISELSASRDLRMLTDRGLLSPVGENRGRWYVAGEQLVALAKSVLRPAEPEVDDPFGTD